MKALAQLVKIGEKAIEHHKLQRATADSKAALNAAYAKWKDEHGVERVEQGTSDWDEMVEATTPQFKAYQKAMATEYNAKQRLKRAAMTHLLTD